jgi:cell division protein FtsQ
MAAAAVAGLSILAVGGWRLGASDLPERTWTSLKWRVIAAAADLGLKVDEVLVVGRRQTGRDELLDAVRLARGAPMLAVDPAATKARIERLPWVRTAAVERMLPDTVLVTLTERRPLALWQNKGSFSLIDDQGSVIVEAGIERFSDLLVVVGQDAPAHAAELVRMLATQPTLMRMVKAAVRVGGRRWTVRMQGGIDVRLPESDPAAAWARLAQYDRSHQVLARDIRVLDLRLPDRITVNGPRLVPPEHAEPGRET